MALDIQAELTAMATMTVGQLRERYACLFQEESRSGNRRHLISGSRGDCSLWSWAHSRNGRCNEPGSWLVSPRYASGRRGHFVRVQERRIAFWVCSRPETATPPAFAALLGA